MATSNSAIIWFRRSDGELISTNDGSEACKYMRSEPSFEEVTEPVASAPASTLSTPPAQPTTKPATVKSKSKPKGAKGNNGA